MIRIIDDSHHDLVLHAEPQGNGAVLIVVDQVGGPVHRIQDPEAVPGHFLQPGLLPEKLDLRGKGIQLLFQIILYRKIHLGHIIRPALLLDVPGHLPVFNQVLCRFYQVDDLLDVWGLIR